MTARRKFLVAVALLVSAAVLACSLDDGGVVPFGGDDTTDGSTAPGDAQSGSDSSIPTDSSTPTDGSLPVDGGSDASVALRFCDLQDASAPFFFCADFDDDAATHGFTETVNDGGTIAFPASDASAPNCFSSTLVTPLATDQQNAVLSMAFTFPAATTEVFTRLRLSYDLRVDGLDLDAASGAFVNTVTMFLEPQFALFSPIAARADAAPTSEIGNVDFNDGGIVLTVVGDGGTKIGGWRHVVVELAVPPSAQATATVYFDGVLSSTAKMSLSPLAVTSRQWNLFLGLGAKGPVSAHYDIDNVVLTSDKK